MALSIQKRWEIIFLKKHIYGPKWNDNEISEFLGVDRKTVKKWVERYEKTGNVEDIEGRGRLWLRKMNSCLLCLKITRT